MPCYSKKHKNRVPPNKTIILDPKEAILSTQQLSSLRI